MSLSELVMNIPIFIMSASTNVPSGLPPIFLFTCSRQLKNDEILVLLHLRGVHPLAEAGVGAQQRAHVLDSEMHELLKVVDVILAPTPVRIPDALLDVSQRQTRRRQCPSILVSESLGSLQHFLKVCLLNCRKSQLVLSRIVVIT